MTRTYTCIPPPSASGGEELSRRDATFRALYADPRAVLATADDLLAAMDEAGVDVAVAVGIGWTDPGVAREANDYLVESTARSGGRLLAFGSVNPAWGDDALAEVERCAAAGLVGVGELHPDTQGYGIENASVMAPLMALAKRLGMPVLTHASEPVGHSYPGKGTVTPDRLMRFIEAFPGQPVIAAHWGGGLPFYALMPEVKARPRRRLLRHGGVTVPLHIRRIPERDAHCRPGTRAFRHGLPPHQTRPLARAGAGERPDSGGTGPHHRRQRGQVVRDERLTLMETLPDHLRPGLDIVLVGLNPSIPSARTGRYFANPRNRFWRAFNAAGLTPEPLGPETDHRMLEFGIGMTDVVKRPTAGVGDLKAADFRDGAAALRERLLAGGAAHCELPRRHGYVPVPPPRARRPGARNAGPAGVVHRRRRSLRDAQPQPGQRQLQPGGPDRMVRAA